MLDWFGRKLREMQEVKRDERGFTLIELLVVVIIIGILAAIAIPTFLSQRDSAYEAGAQSALRNAAAAATSCSADVGNDGSFANCGDGELAAYGYRADSDVTLTITQNDADGWAANAVNTNGGGTFEYSTDTGQVAPQ